MSDDEEILYVQCSKIKTLPPPSAPQAEQIHATLSIERCESLPRFFVPPEEVDYTGVPDRGRREVATPSPSAT